MNKVILMGRLTDEPQLKYSQQNTPFVSIALAVNKRFAKEGQSQADFINCIAWNKTAEFVCKHFQKGGMIAVSGRLQSRNWDDKDRKRQYVTEVVVEDAYFTGERADNYLSNVRPTAIGSTKQEFESFDATYFTQIDDDDIPF